MTSIELRPDLAEKLNQEAERRQTNVADLANDWLEEQLWQTWHSEIEAEAERFRALHAQLLEQYRGQHIAMRNGVVVDRDVDLATLHARIRATFGNQPVLIAPVTDEPLQKFRVLGGRLK